MPSPYAPRTEAAMPAPKSQLSMPAAGATAAATATPPPPSELSLVPPMPPREPMAKGAVVQPPQPPSQSTRDAAVIPADGTLPAVSSPPGVQPAAFTTVAAQPGRTERDTRPEPRVDALPSPFAKSTAPAPTLSADASANLQNLRRLGTAATKKWESITTYEARLTRRETVGGKAQPEEEVLYRLRKEPFAVFMRNTGEVGKGREVMYNPSQHGDMMHIAVGAGDSLIFKAGRRVPSMSPDNKMVTDKSRHNIRDSGFGYSISKFNSLIEKMQMGRLKPDALVFAGVEPRRDMPGFTLERVDQTINPGDDPLMSHGGKRFWYFDAKPDSQSFGLPVLVVTFESTNPTERPKNGTNRTTDANNRNRTADANNREVEYYRFDKFRIPADLKDSDFNPDILGKK